MHIQGPAYGMIWECTYPEKKLLSCSDGQVFEEDTQVYILIERFDMFAGYFVLLVHDYPGFVSSDLSLLSDVPLATLFPPLEFADYSTDIILLPTSICKVRDLLRSAYSNNSNQMSSQRASSSSCTLQDFSTVKPHMTSLADHHRSHHHFQCRGTFEKGIRPETVPHEILLRVLVCRMFDGHCWMYNPRENHALGSENGNPF